MNKVFAGSLSVLLLASCALAQRTGTGTVSFFDSNAYSDSMRITLTNLSDPASGKVYVAWLGNDDDVQYLKLGELMVSSGEVSFGYKDPADNNLLASNKKFLVTEENSPFNGTMPALNSLVFADSLHGPGVPSATSPLGRIRNCLVTFSNTAQSLGLAVWMKKHIQLYLDHAGFARDGAFLNNNPGEASTHSDHVYDFITGSLINVAHGSIAANGDPVGYSFRRYADQGTGVAGPLGGAGYHVGLVVNDPAASLQMKKAGSRALIALDNALGTANDAGWGKEVSDHAQRLNDMVYLVTGNLTDEGIPFFNLATKFVYGTVGPQDTAATTGGIIQAYYHIQQMAAFILNVLQPTSVERIGTELPERFALHQNYPNPFNGETKISFQLPFAGRVSITIYNILGQEIARLVDNRELPGGTYRVVWQSGSAVSGTYLYELRGMSLDNKSSFVDVRPMVLVK